MGEYQADQFMASKGYTKLNHNGELIDPLTKAKGKGIDGIWHDPGPPPKYIVSETKYGSSKLGIEQPSDQWIKNNLDLTISNGETCFRLLLYLKLTLIPNIHEYPLSRSP